MTNTAETAARDAMLEAALPNIPFDGWNKTGFPRGATDAIAHFSDWADQHMVTALQAHDLPAMKVRERITLSVRTRLELLENHREAVRSSLSILAMPVNSPLAARLLARTADAMWHAARDTSTDFNYYTKRALLMAVQAATVVYWLNDESEGRAETWAFLDRRIANVLKVGKGIGAVKNLKPPSFLFAPFRALRERRKRA